MGDSATQYPYNYPIKGCFIVLNCMTERSKTIRIWDYPIPVGTTRDLLRIPGIDESDIRASLLKGVLRNKLLAKEISIICSDVDLLQFNNTNKEFLQNSGITIGLEISNNEIHHDTLRDLIHFIDEGPGNGFNSGAFKEVIGQPFPSSIIWYVDDTKAFKIIEKLISYNGNNLPQVLTWNMYDINGISIIHTVVDTITYQNNAFESTRIRTISN